MKASVLCVFLLLFPTLSPSLCAQTRFNIRYNSGYHYTTFSSVVEVEDEYYVVGWLGILNHPFTNPSIFARFDADGEVIDQKVFGGLDDHIYRAFNPDLTMPSDTTFMYSGTTFDDNGTSQAYIAYHNLEGDTLEVQRFYHPEYPDVIDNATGGALVTSASDGNVFFLRRYHLSGDPGHSLLEKRSTTGALMWSFTTDATTDDDVFGDVVLPTPFGGCWWFPTIYDESTGNGEMKMYALNLAGAVSSEVDLVPPTGSRSLRDVLRDGDAFIGCSEIADPTSNTALPYLMKFTETGDIEWYATPWENDYATFNSGLHVTLASDGEGYILGGTRDKLVEFPTDSTGLGDERAYLAKFSNDGEQLWYREFHYLNVPMDNHRLYDLEATSDGGYVFCGEATDSGPDTPAPWVQGWLVKVDEHGCLVEGCHLADNIEEVQDPTKGYFLAGPIPAQHTLNLALLQRLPQGSAFELYTASGALVDRFETAHQAGTTLMLDTSSYPAGQYVVVLKVDGEGVQRMRVVVE